MGLKSKTTLLKSYDELTDKQDFKPFLLNLEKLRKAYGRI
jgi:hypothetical protein